MSDEQYGEIYRNPKRGVPVEPDVRVTNRFLDDDPQAYNSRGTSGAPIWQTRSSCWGPTSTAGTAAQALRTTLLEVRS